MEKFITFEERTLEQQFSSKVTVEYSADFQNPVETTTRTTPLVGFQGKTSL